MTYTLYILQRNSSPLLLSLMQKLTHQFYSKGNDLRPRTAFLIALGIHLEKNTRTKSTSPPGTYKTSLDTSLSLKSLSLQRKQINRVKSNGR